MCSLKLFFCTTKQLVNETNCSLYKRNATLIEIVCKCYTEMKENKIKRAPCISALKIGGNTLSWMFRLKLYDVEKK